MTQHGITNRIIEFMKGKARSGGVISADIGDEFDLTTQHASGLLAMLVRNKHAVRAGHFLMADKGKFWTVYVLSEEIDEFVP